MGPEPGVQKLAKCGVRSGSLKKKFEIAGCIMIRRGTTVNDNSKCSPTVSVLLLFAHFGEEGPITCAVHVRYRIAERFKRQEHEVANYPVH